jgi:hypothetical protein
MSHKVDFFVDVPDTPRSAVGALLRTSDSLSVKTTESTSESESDSDSDSEAEEDVFVMEMEPSPRPLSLASSKKLSELCEYISDEEARGSRPIPPAHIAPFRLSLSTTMAWTACWTRSALPIARSSEMLSFSRSLSTSGPTRTSSSSRLGRASRISALV